MVLIHHTQLAAMPSNATTAHFQQVAIIKQHRAATGALGQLDQFQQRTFARARYADNSELVIQEVKGPSAQLGTAKVPGPDGGTVAATQGSDAYLRWVLRMDTQLRDKVLADSALLHGLLEGTTKLRYRLVQPNEAGYVRVAEFIIDQSKLDLRGWLEGP